MNIAKLAGAAALLAVSTAQAQQNNLDVYYADSTVEVTVPGFGSFDEDGDGFGVRGAFAISELAAVTAEYQAVTFDDSDLDLDQLRAGLLIALSAFDTPLSWYAAAEYIRLEADDGFDSDSDSGFGLHVGGRFEVVPGLGLGARVGYVDIDDSDGIEWLVEAVLAATPTLAVFADYRLTSVEDDDVETDLDDLRLGVRLRF